MGKKYILSNIYFDTKASYLYHICPSYRPSACTDTTSCIQQKCNIFWK